MSLRLDASEYYANSLVLGNTGLGELAENIPSTGDSGASILFNDITLPADNGEEIRAEILTVPGSGSFFVYEDGSFEFSGAADGAYSVSYRLWVDGVDSGTATANLLVGPQHALASTGLPVFSLTPPTGSAVGAGSAIAFCALSSITLTAPDGTAIGTVAGDALAFGVISPISLSAPSGTATGTSTGTGGEVTLSPATIAALSEAIANAVWAHPDATNISAIAAAVWGYEGP